MSIIVTEEYTNVNKDCLVKFLYHAIKQTVSKRCSFLVVLEKYFQNFQYLHKSSFCDIMYTGSNASYNKKGIRLIIRVRRFPLKMLVGI